MFTNPLFLTTLGLSIGLYVVAWLLKPRHHPAVVSNPPDPATDYDAYDDPSSYLGAFTKIASIVVGTLCLAAAVVVALTGATDPRTLPKRLSDTTLAIKFDDMESSKSAMETERDTAVENEKEARKLLGEAKTEVSDLKGKLKVAEAKAGSGGTTTVSDPADKAKITQLEKEKLAAEAEVAKLKLAALATKDEDAKKFDDAFPDWKAEEFLEGNSEGIKIKKRAPKGWTMAIRGDGKGTWKDAPQGRTTKEDLGWTNMPKVIEVQFLKHGVRKEDDRDSSVKEITVAP